MNLKNQREALISLIRRYLAGQASLEELNNYSWMLIDYFTKTNKTELPPIEEFENEFWYTIWQIQHLADESHEKDHLTQRALKQSLGYLERVNQLPKEFYGRRP